jgi:hypothetical protein
MEAPQLISKSNQFIPVNEALKSLGAVLLHDFNVVERSEIKFRRELIEIAKVLFTDNVEIARRTALAYFMDEQHAEYFMRYVYPFRKRIREMTFSENYLGIRMVNKNYEFSNGIYVIGVNDFADGLFINHSDSYWDSPILLIASKDDGRQIQITTDDSFRKLLNYDVDVLEPKALISIKTPNGVAYRVSGEIVFYVSPIDDNFVKLFFMPQVRRLLSYVIADKILRLLLDHGFNPTFTGFHLTNAVISIPGALTGKLLDRDAVKESRAVIFAFKDMLAKYFNILNVGMYEDDPRISNTIIIEDDFAVANVWIIFDRRQWGHDHADLNIEIGIDDGNEKTKSTLNSIISDIKDSILKELEESDRTDVFNVNGHVITVRNGLPLNITYEPQLKPQLLEPLMLTAHEPSIFMVSPRSTVKISHVQHGEKELTFDNNYVITIRTTAISSEQIRKMNVIALRKLLGEVR